MSGLGPRKTTAEIRREVLKEITASGLLGEMQMKAFRSVCRNGPMSGRMLNDDLDIPHAHVRLHELEAMGAIEVVGTMTCGVTGRNVTAWDVTGRMAHAAPKKIKGIREAPHIHKVVECKSCLLLDEDEDGNEVCWMNSSLRCPMTGRHPSCPLNMRDFVIRAG